MTRIRSWEKLSTTRQQVGVCEICGEAELAAPYMLECIECGREVCEAHRETDYDGEKQTVRCVECLPKRCASCGSATALHAQRDDLDGYLLDGVYRCEACCDGRCGERACRIASAS